jgi:hypothetical protein
VLKRTFVDEFKRSPERFSLCWNLPMIGQLGVGGEVEMRLSESSSI